MIKKERKPLIRELTLTVLGLSAAMIFMWFLFYAVINRVIMQRVMQSMEHVSRQIISEMEKSFLNLEEVSFAIKHDEDVKAVLKQNDHSKLVEYAGKAEARIGQLVQDNVFVNNLIVYNVTGDFYRFAGNLDNTSVKYVIQSVERGGLKSQIRIKVEARNYIGYVSDIYDGNERKGAVVILTEEEEVYRLFEQAGKDENLRIALAADDRIILSNYADYIEKDALTVESESGYCLYRKVGFTPFGLLVSYEDSNRYIRIIFFVAMLIMALILFAILEVFLYFWRKKFFSPIQSVITGVEGFDGGKGEQIPLTGMEHFDGLVRGINDMVERIEQKEKEVYEASFSLQEAELKKQKALIVSLKKQISAHFTVNILNIIKALSVSGENERAGLLCDGLSFLLRYANAGDSFISGMDEFFVLSKYAEIMEIRYPGRFTVDIDMVDELEEIELPRMLLQPIIENSIVHGIIGGATESGGEVHLYSEMADDKVRFVIEDNGCGMSAAELEELRENITTADAGDVEVEGLSHVALVNIERRIHSYFGKEYGITIESEPGKGSKITVEIPRCKRFA
ncbi:MAG: histidine kinase [Lachnospiraceae bacterium]|nr:histidine kinase [Lachnospiraceae bacterium]